jgi:hypothetical protein
MITGDGPQECDRICVCARLPRNVIEVARGWARPSPDRVLAIPPDRGFFIEASPVRRHGPVRKHSATIEDCFRLAATRANPAMVAGLAPTSGLGDLREEVGAAARVGCREQRKATSPCRPVDIYEGYRDRVSLGNASLSRALKPCGRLCSRGGGSPPHTRRFAARRDDIAVRADDFEAEIVDAARTGDSCRFPPWMRMSGAECPRSFGGRNEHSFANYQRWHFALCRHLRRCRCREFRPGRRRCVAQIDPAGRRLARVQSERWNRIRYDKAFVLHQLSALLARPEGGCFRC